MESGAGFLLVEDEVEELAAEVRGRAYVRAFDLDVVQVLELESAVAGGVAFSA